MQILVANCSTHLHKLTDNDALEVRLSFGFVSLLGAFGRAGWGGVGWGERAASNRSLERAPRRRRPKGPKISYARNLISICFKRLENPIEYETPV